MLGFHWREAAYVDLSLPMGLASSSNIFQTFSDALIWIAQNKFSAGPMVSVLDDFLFVRANREDCLRALNGFRRMCEELHIPLRADKTVDPRRSDIPGGRTRCGRSGASVASRESATGTLRGRIAADPKKGHITRSAILHRIAKLCVRCYSARAHFSSPHVRPMPRRFTAIPSCNAHKGSTIGSQSVAGSSFIL